MRHHGCWLLCLVVTLFLLVGCGTDFVDDVKSTAPNVSALAPQLSWGHVDIGGGRRVSLALNNAGDPALSYERGAPRADLIAGDVTVVYAANDGRWRSGAGWTTNDVGYTPNLIEGDTSLAFAGAVPQIAFTSRDRTDRDSGFVLKHARRGPTSWAVETVDPIPWVYQTAQLVRERVTYLGYGSTAQPGVLLASLKGSTWTFTSDPDLPHDLLMSIDLGATQWSSLPKIGFATSKLGAAGGIFFALSSNGGSVWTAPVQVDTGAAIRPRIVFASATKIMIGYTILSGMSTGTVKLATSNDSGASWTTETVVSYADYAPSADVAVDASGDPLLAVVVTDTDAGMSYAYLARRIKGSWSLVEADAIGAPWIIGLPQIAATPDGRVVLAYDYRANSSQGQLCMVRVTWTTSL